MVSPSIIAVTFPGMHFAFPEQLLIGSGCTGSGCTGSGCTGSGCTGSGCTGSGCTGSGF